MSFQTPTHINAYRLALEEAEKEYIAAKAKRDDAKALLKEQEDLQPKEEAETPVAPTGVDDDTNNTPKKTDKQEAQKLGVDKKPKEDNTTPTRLNANPEAKKSEERSNRPAGKYRVPNNSTGKTGANF